MRILYISSDYEKQGSVWHYRCSLPGERLKRLGHVVRYWQELSEDEDILAHDLIVFQLQTHPVMFQLAQAGKLKGVRIVYETDDNHFLFDPMGLNPYKFSSSFTPEKLEVMKDFLHLAHGVTCTNSGHAEFLKRYNKNTFILPNSFDLENFPKPEKNKTKEIRVGISGSASHFGDWAEIIKVYTDMLEKYPQVKLVMLGKPYKPLFAHIPEDRIEFHAPTVFQDYYKTLASLRLDFSLIPLRDIPFNNQGKSNVKALEYGALKIPSICSKVLPYEETIIHGENGFLVSKYADWMSAIDRLVVNKALRERVGESIYKTIEDKYDISKTVKLWDQAYKSL